LPLCRIAMSTLLFTPVGRLLAARPLNFPIVFYMP
jgi:hypothetical protein